MTDRFNAFVVVLDNDIRDDDAAPLMGAIRQLRGVVSVTGNVSDMGSHIAKEKAKQEIWDKIVTVLRT